MSEKKSVEQGRESTAGARPAGDGTNEADPRAHPELAIPDGLRAFCSGCAQDIKGEAVAVPTMRGTLTYSHDDPICLESAMAASH